MREQLATALAPLTDRGVRRRYREGALIFAEGDRGSEVLLVTDGVVHLVVGSDRDIAALGPGDLLGEFAALDGRPRSASAHARTAVELVAFSASDVLDVIERSPDLDLAASRTTVASGRRHTEMRSVAVGGLPVGQLARRLAARLDGDHRMVDIDAGALATSLEVSREQLARALDELHHRGVVALERGRVVVLDADDLRRVADEE
ncbi:MAG: Crp/Fnr family transcriptional regulator [Acidimicrobiia bacterium]|nr:Crp/Fnr family transcriptional regulator [Acidimicrobiia bacterium]